MFLSASASASANAHLQRSPDRIETASVDTATKTVAVIPIACCSGSQTQSSLRTDSVSRRSRTSHDICQKIAAIGDVESPVKRLRCDPVTVVAEGHHAISPRPVSPRHQEANSSGSCKGTRHPLGVMYTLRSQLKKVATFGQINLSDRPSMTAADRLIAGWYLRKTGGNGNGVKLTQHLSDIKKLLRGAKEEFHSLVIFKYCHDPAGWTLLDLRGGGSVPPSVIMVEPANLNDVDRLQAYADIALELAGLIEPSISRIGLIELDIQRNPEDNVMFCVALTAAAVEHAGVMLQLHGSLEGGASTWSGGRATKEGLLADAGIRLLPAIYLPAEFVRHSQFVEILDARLNANPDSPDRAILEKSKTRCQDRMVDGVIQRQLVSIEYERIRVIERVAEDIKRDSRMNGSMHLSTSLLKDARAARDRLAAPVDSNVFDHLSAFALNQGQAFAPCASSFGTPSDGSDLFSAIGGSASRKGATLDSRISEKTMQILSFPPLMGGAAFVGEAAFVDGAAFKLCRDGLHKAYADILNKRIKTAGELKEILAVDRVLLPHIVRAENLRKASLNLTFVEDIQTFAEGIRQLVASASQRFIIQIHKGFGHYIFADVQKQPHLPASIILIDPRMHCSDGRAKKSKLPTPYVMLTELLSCGGYQSHVSVFDTNVGRSLVGVSMIYCISYALKADKHVALFNEWHSVQGAGKSIAKSLIDSVSAGRTGVGVDSLSSALLPVDFIKHGQNSASWLKRSGTPSDLADERAMLDAKLLNVNRRSKHVVINYRAPSIDYKRLSFRARIFRPFIERPNPITIGQATASPSLLFPYAGEQPVGSLAMIDIPTAEDDFIDEVLRNTAVGLSGF